MTALKNPTVVYKITVSKGRVFGVFPGFSGYCISYSRHSVNAAIFARAAITFAEADKGIYANSNKTKPRLIRGA